MSSLFFNLIMSSSDIDVFLIFIGIITWAHLIATCPCLKKVFLTTLCKYIDTIYVHIFGEQN